MSTLKTTNLQNASASSPAIVLAADGSATANLSSVNGGPIAGSRNRIINGDMRIDQRNAGASVSVTDGTYTVDRFKYVGSSSRITAQRSTSSLPVGFDYALLLTSVGANTPSSEANGIWQVIEANNVSDLAYGTANAKTTTLSFWVRSSAAATYGGAIQNASLNRSYPFSYTINSTNTWEYKTIAITGDTSGTWNTTGTSGGLTVVFSSGASSGFKGTANTWAGADYRDATGTSNLQATNAATLSITGVQLEPGTVATPFERRSYGQELALAQRYYQASGFMVNNAGSVYTNYFFKQPMRAVPTVTTSSSSPSSTTVDGFYLGPVGSAIGGVAITASAELWVEQGGTPEPAPIPEPPAPLTTEQKLEAAGLTVAELKALFGLT
jgi:hypothetical protein